MKREIIAVCSKSHIKYINIIPNQNVENLIVEYCG